MKLDTTDNTETFGNIDYEDSTDSKISEAAMAHVTKLLKFLYNDPMSAVFREYTANALDAHSACGNTDPIKVFLPTFSTPVFTVTDEGIGMSAETLRKIFAQFGESTKTSSNLEIGGFGLGSKSGLAIASQLTIISIKDGIRVTAIYSNNEDGLAKLNIVDSRETSDPNGTSIAIPIDNVEDFRDKAMAYFPFFEPNTVDDYESGITENYREKYEDELVEKLRIDSVDTTVSIFTNVVDEYLGSSYKEATGVYLVMGGIPYIIPEDALAKNLSGDSLQFVSLFNQDSLMVIDAPIGSVKLSPSREGIQFNDNTREYFQTVFSESISNFVKKAVESIENADTFQDAVNQTRRLPRGLYDTQKIEWNGVSTKGDGSVFTLRTQSLLATTDYNDAIETRSSNVRTNSYSLGQPIVLIHGTVSEKTARRYLGTYLRECVGDAIVTYFTTPALKKDEEFDLEEFKNSIQFAPSYSFSEPDDWNYKTYEESSLAKSQILSLEEVAGVHVMGEDFIRFVSYDDMKKEVLAARRALAKATREAGASAEEKVKLATKYMTLVAGEMGTSGTSVSDINDLQSVILVSEDNVGKWREGVGLLSTDLNRFDSRAVSAHDALFMGSEYKGKTFVFVTGTRSATHAAKLFSGTKVVQFDSEKYYVKLLKTAKKTFDPKTAMAVYLLEALPSLPEDVAKKIRDPELKKIFLSSNSLSMTEKARWTARNIPSSDMGVDREILSVYGSGWVNSKDMNKYFGYENLITKYSLLKSIGHNLNHEGYEHFVAYLNMIHSKDKTKCFTDVFSRDTIN